MDVFFKNDLCKNQLQFKIRFWSKFPHTAITFCLCHVVLEQTRSWLALKVSQQLHRRLCKNFTGGFKDGG